MTFLTMLSVILLSILMLLSILSVIRHLICGNNLNWLLNLNLVKNRGKKWLADVNAGKIQLILFDWANSSGSFDVKMDGSVLEKKSSFKILGLTFSSKLNRSSYIISIAKSASKNIGTSIHCIKFFLQRLLCIFINPSYAHILNTVVTSGLVPLVANWNC